MSLASAATMTVVAVGALGVAAMAAAADGALLALDDADPDPALAALARHGRPLHRALGFTRVAGYLAGGYAAAAALTAQLVPGSGRWLLIVAVLLLATALMESIAREIGDAGGARLARALTPVTRVLELLFAPVVRLAAAIDATLLRALPTPRRDEEEREATAEQFRQVVTNEADVSGDEEALLHGVFSLGDTSVGEIMVPRVDIVGIERETPWSEVVDRVRSSEHARLPVYNGTLDDIVGVLYAKDMVGAVLADEPPASGWTMLVRPAVFIPATNAIDAQLREFKSSRTHIAIVIDEYGGTAGLVTIEDVLEEIVGDIRDEYDEEEPEIETGRDGRRYWIAGRVSIDELSDVLGHEFASDDITTVGGLVYEELGRVPRAGEEFEMEGFRVVVERVRRRRIERVYFERLERRADDARAGASG